MEKEKRPYTKRTREERYNAMIKKLTRLKEAHDKRALKIAKIQAKTEKLKARLTPKN